MKDTMIPVSKAVYELVKLFPEAKIPLPDHASYYLEQLQKSKEFESLPNKLAMTLDLLSKYGNKGKHGLDASAYKQRKVEEFLVIMNDRKEYLHGGLMTQVATKHGLVGKTVKYLDGHEYVSIDITSANFTVMRHFTGIKEKTWGDWVAANMEDMHPALVASKSYRQNMFGNLAPKRIQALTCKLNAENVKIVEENGYFDIVGVSHDEIVVDVTNKRHQVAELQNLPWQPDVPVKLSYFAVRQLLNEGPEAHVRIVLGDPAEITWSGIPALYKQLKGIQGHRFHRLFKQHVLHEDVTDMDNYFIQDGHIATWVD